MLWYSSFIHVSDVVTVVGMSGSVAGQHIACAQLKSWESMPDTQLQHQSMSNRRNELGGLQMMADHNGMSTCSQLLPVLDQSRAGIRLVLKPAHLIL